MLFFNDYHFAANRNRFPNELVVYFSVEISSVRLWHFPLPAIVKAKDFHEIGTLRKRKKQPLAAFCQFHPYVMSRGDGVGVESYDRPNEASS